MLIFMVHQNFPSQFRNVLNKLAENPNNTFYCFCNGHDIKIDSKNINAVIITERRADSLEFNGVQTMGAMLSVCNSIKARPDLIITHIGFGHDMYIREIFPDVPIIGHFEFYYDGKTSSEFARNMLLRDQVNKCSVCISPTLFQKSCFPPDISHRILTIHDGIDTEFYSPGGKRSDKLVTYISRGLEPIREFPEFISATKMLLDEMPDVKIFIVGKDEFCYTTNKDNRSLMTEAKETLKDHLNRVKFCGAVTKQSVRDIMRISTVHVYLTKPYVLSWSMLEAMSCGCTVVGTDNSTVSEFITDTVNGFLSSTENIAGLKNCIKKALELSPSERNEIGEAARNTIIDRVEKNKCTEKWMNIVSSLSPIEKATG